MSDNQKTKSIFLTFLMFTSLCVGLISIPVASAVTTSGTITASETWSGTVNLNGNVTVAEGATLVINGGTRINIPAGDRLIVETPGGGGYGQPKARERSAVVDDLDNGKISMDSARQIYGLDLSGVDQP